MTGRRRIPYQTYAYAPADADQATIDLIAYAAVVQEFSAGATELPEGYSLVDGGVVVRPWAEGAPEGHVIVLATGVIEQPPSIYPGERV